MSPSGLWNLTDDVARFLRDPVELVDEVHVPRRAAELAVRRGLQSDLLLHAHGLADRLVLDRTQLGVVDAPAACSSRASSSRFGRNRLPT